jgi:hypothetical protein
VTSLLVVVDSSITIVAVSGNQDGFEPKTKIVSELFAQVSGN